MSEAEKLATPYLIYQGSSDKIVKINKIQIDPETAKQFDSLTADVTNKKLIMIEG